MACGVGRAATNVAFTFAGVAKIGKLASKAALHAVGVGSAAKASLAICGVGSAPMGYLEAPLPVGEETAAELAATISAWLVAVA